MQAAGYEGKMKMGMDPAASEFYIDGKYDLDFKNKAADGSRILTGYMFECFPKSHALCIRLCVSHCM